MLKRWIAGEPKPTLVCVCIGAAALVLSLGGWLRGPLPFDIAWVAIVLCGVPILAGAATALVREHNIKADLLVSLALIASVLIGEYFAAGEVALIMQVGTLLEDLTAGKARSGIEKLIDLTPQTAHLIREDGMCTQPVGSIAAGDRLMVLAGERVPVDGVILSGETAIDQSVMTGESIPVDKKAGDEVTSGTLNQYGTFEMRALCGCADSSLQRMVRLAEEADANKAPIVGLADKWATWMVLAALALAALTGLISGEIIRAVTVLVVFCPCAFILATPTAIMAGIGSAARHGVLIRSGDALERLSKTQIAAFDKTGTLTPGKPRVTGVVSFSALLPEKEILRLAALAEQRSEHPLGKAILAHYTETGGEVLPPDAFEVCPGLGVRARVEGRELAVGKPGMFAEDAVFPAARQAAELWYGRGATVVFLSVDGVLGGLLALADTVRPEAAAAIGRLKADGILPVLLTGDHAAAAGAAAAAAGISEVRASLSPEDKMAAIRELGQTGRPVCMVGDGVNDALALRTAFAGIAMGGIGSDIAVESADAVLVGDDLRRLPALFASARHVMRKVRQNILLSLGINLVAVTLSVLGLLNPVTGALMHNCGSVFVVLNAAALLRGREWGK